MFFHLNYKYTLFCSALGLLLFPFFPFFGSLLLAPLGYYFDRRLIQKKKALGIYKNMRDRKKHNKLTTIRTILIQGYKLLTTEEFRPLSILITGVTLLFITSNILIGTLSYMNKKGTHREFIGKTIEDSQGFITMMSHMVPKINKIPPPKPPKYYSWEKVKFGQLIYAINWFSAFIQTILILRIISLLNAANLLNQKKPKVSDIIDTTIWTGIIGFCIIYYELFSGLTMHNTYYTLHLMTMLGVLLVIDPCIMLYRRVFTSR